MSNWGGLNNALFSWRNGVNALFPHRGTASDGGRADSKHASTSEHQPDSDGTVDAFDEDRNYLGSSDDDGNAWEDQILDALNKDFMADRRAHLIIHDRTIMNDQIDNWRKRSYGGTPHTRHTHRQVHQSLEDDGRPWKFTNTKALLKRMNGEDDVTPAELRAAVLAVLKSEEGQNAIELAAGRGVHAQKLFRSEKTIGDVLYTTVGGIAEDTAAIRTAVTPAVPPTTDGK